MSDIRLTCEETPLAWPASISIEELKTCKTCGIHIHAPHPGSLQLLTRRQSEGSGDGVNVDESISVGADYRGQRYALDEAIFHTPGLHKFPGQKELYPAEYHIHMRTASAPQRYITIVVPVSHMVSKHNPGTAYFAAMKAKPDATAVRPTLESLFDISGDIKILQYQGPDIRGRTGDEPEPEDVCKSYTERQFLLVLNVAHIRATDLERIPREGSLSTDPRDLPAPGVSPKKTIVRDRLLRSAVLAVPGVLKPKKESTTKAVTTATTTGEKELECKPVKVVNGRDVIDISGKSVDIMALLGLEKKNGLGATEDSKKPVESTLTKYTSHAMFFVGTIVGLLLSDFFIGLLWGIFFTESGGRRDQWEPIKLWIFLGISLTAAGLSGGILGAMGLVPE